MADACPRFQQLAFVKDILTNEEKRRVYDGIFFVFLGCFELS
jgi:hypothetical protein